MPGLIVDKYEDVLVVQILSLGMEKRKEWILQALLDVFQPKAIYLRNDVHVRELEGLKQEKGFWYGACDTNVQIEENGVKYIVDIENGQKQGFSSISAKIAPRSSRSLQANRLCSIVLRIQDHLC